MNVFTRRVLRFTCRSRLRFRSIHSQKYLFYKNQVFECSKFRNLSVTYNVLLVPKFSLNSFNLSATSYASSSSSNSNKEKEEVNEILKDFAKDFQVTSEDEKILDEIKRNDRDFSDDKIRQNDDTTETLRAFHTITKTKFKEFTDEDSTIIPSIEEEEQFEEKFFHIDQEYKSHRTSYEAKRGVEGVYDIGELVAVLRDENLFDISVIRIPDTYHYTDYMVLATAKSPKHSAAVAEFIIKFYKMKKYQTDPFIIVEGENVDNWKAIDMGNIVLHIFLEDARTLYDIESLWLLDGKFDSGGMVQVDPMYEAMKDEMEFFDSLNFEENTKENEK